MGAVCRMRKINKRKTAYFMMGICLLAAGALLYYLLIPIFEDFEFKRIGRKGTTLEFDVDNPAGMGFDHDVTVYTENGITSVAFTGKVTVEGSAEIMVTANEDNRVVYQGEYSHLNAEKIYFKVDDLVPYSYYTLRFSSKDAKKGALLLEANQSLAEHPERQKRAQRSK